MYACMLHKTNSHASIHACIHSYIHTCIQIQYYVRASHPVNVYVLDETNYHKYSTKAAFSFEAGPTLLDSKNHSLEHYVVQVKHPSRYIVYVCIYSFLCLCVF